MRCHVFAVLFGVVAVSCAQNTTFPGYCPTVLPLTNFNATKYAGPWYEISKFNNTLVAGDCGYSNYTWTKNQFNVTYVTRNLQLGQNTSTVLVLKPQFNSPVVAGRFDVYHNGITKQQIPHYVLDTDYTSYSVVWGCAYSSGNNTQRLFIYSRRPTLSKESYARANATLTSYKLDHRKLVNIVQDSKKCGRSKTLWQKFLSYF